MRLIDLLHFGEKELEAAGVEEYQLDARILLEYCTGKSRTAIYLDGGTRVNKEVQDELPAAPRIEKKTPTSCLYYR